MTVHDQNKAIAEYLGYEVLIKEGFVRANYEKNMYRIRGETDWMVMPDYTSDLNAMHEAEKSLPAKKIVWYMQKLTQVRYRQGDSGTIACMIDRTCFATASQRAEAFLKTIDKWID